MRSFHVFAVAVLTVAFVDLVSEGHATPIAGGLRLWLDGNDATTVSGTPVASWSDKSTFSNDATAAGSNQPAYNAGSGANGTGELIFDATANNRLDAGTVIPTNSSASIFFILDRPADGGISTGRGGIFQRQTVSPYTGFAFGQGSPTTFGFSVNDGGDSAVVNSTPKAGLQLWQGSVEFNANPGTTTVRLFEDGGLVGSDTSTIIDGIGTGSDSLLIMNRDFVSNFDMTGEVSEVIVYDRVVNAAERAIVQNYISSKYDLTLTAGDFYDGDTLANSHFDHDVFGVGNDQTGSDSGSLTSGTSTSQAIVISSTNLDDGDFILAGFQNDNDFTQSTIYIDTTELDGNEQITLAFDVGILGLESGLALGFNSDDPDGLEYIVSGTQVGDMLSFVLSGAQLQDGFYGLVQPVPEPSSFLLLGLGMLGFLCHNRRRKRTS